MKKLSHEKFFREMKNRRNRVIYVKGVGEIVAPKDYSFSQKGGIIHLLLNGKKKVKKEKIHSFPKGVTARTIKEYILNYKILKDYCKAPASQCHQARNCNECHVPHKEWAEKRKEKGEKIVRPGKKIGGFTEAVEERNVSLKRKRLENKESKITFFDRDRSGKWC